jgi:hypothetical protein
MKRKRLVLIATILLIFVGGSVFAETKPVVNEIKATIVKEFSPLIPMEILSIGEPILYKPGMYFVPITTQMKDEPKMKFSDFVVIYHIPGKTKVHTHVPIAEAIERYPDAKYVLIAAGYF